MKNLKNFNFNLGIIDWQKSLYTAVAISLIVFSFMVGFLFVKPLEKSISKIIDAEISSTNINFNKKTLEMLNERQKPAQASPASAGKNPFAPF